MAEQTIFDTVALRRRRAALLALPVDPQAPKCGVDDLLISPSTPAAGRQDGQPGGDGGGSGFTRTDQHDFRHPDQALDAWRCGACHQVFWVDLGYAPLACPRCENDAANPPVMVAPRCSICTGPHTPTQCPEVALAKFGMGVWESYMEDKAAFLRLIQWVTSARLLLMGDAVAFYLSHRWGRPIAAYHVLACWKGGQQA
jgi:hypothetical protein